MATISKILNRPLFAPSCDAAQQTALRDRALIIARVAQNGFISRDQQDRWSVSATELSKIRQSSTALLLGGVDVFQGEVILKPGKIFSTETHRQNGRRVWVDTHGSCLQVTVIYQFPGNPPQVLHSGPFKGVRNFGEGRDFGHFQLTIENTENSNAMVFVHTTEADPPDCNVM